MSKSDPSIKINPSKPAELEFDVVVQGTDDKDPPTVRFVIECDTYDRSFKCTRSENGKHTWCAKLPILKELSNESYPFHVEVVIDGYFFAPASGKLHLVQDPTVKFQESTSRPSVTTSFTVKQADDKPAKKEVVKEEKVEEASGGGEITGQYAPTNALLNPEFEPRRPRQDTRGSGKAPGTERDDEHIDKTQLFDLGAPTPGPGTDSVPIGTDTPVIIRSEFNPKDIADQIVKSTVGSLKKPETKGSLFNRGKDGKTVISGIDTPDQIRVRKEKSDRVREILGSN